MDESNIEIGSRLRIARKTLGYKQEDFAELLDITQPYLSALEKGKKEVPTKVIRTLFEKYRVSSDWLLFGIGEIFQEKSKNDTPADEHLIENANKKAREAHPYTEKWKQQVLKELEMLKNPRFEHLDKATLVMDKIVKSDPELEKGIYGMFQMDTVESITTAFYDAYIGEETKKVYNMIDQVVKEGERRINEQFLDEVIEVLRPIRKFANASRQVHKAIQEVLDALKPYDEKGILNKFDPLE